MIPPVLKKILPPELSDAADKLNIALLYELRLRGDRPTVVNYGGQFYYLNASGLTNSAKNAVICSTKNVKDALIRATEYSLYAVNNQLCQGYLTVAGGIRIGVAGETVFSDNAGIKTIKNFNALNVRIPHEVTGCAERILRFIEEDEVHNTLFVSPPGAGKTTLLRDTARLLGSGEKIRNVLVVDERNEIAAMHDGEMFLNAGRNTDVMNGCSKSYAFTRAIRAMRPDVIVTDELCDEEDVTAVAYAVSSGVKVIASVHAQDHLDLLKKPGFERLVSQRVFSRLIDLSDRRGPGTVDGIFDENMEAVYG